VCTPRIQKRKRNQTYNALKRYSHRLKKLSLPTTTGNITGTTTTMSTPVSTTTSTDASPTTTSSPFHYTKQQILEIFKPAKRPIDFNVVAGVVREEAGEPVGWKEIGEEEAKVNIELEEPTRLNVREGVVERGLRMPRYTYICDQHGKVRVHQEL